MECPCSLGGRGPRLRLARLGSRFVLRGALGLLWALGKEHRGFSPQRNPTLAFLKGQHQGEQFGRKTKDRGRAGAEGTRGGNSSPTMGTRVWAAGARPASPLPQPCTSWAERRPWEQPPSHPVDRARGRPRDQGQKGPWSITSVIPGRAAAPNRAICPLPCVSIPPCVFPSPCPMFIPHGRSSISLP